MISQYANSPKFVALVSGLRNMFGNAKTLVEWFNVVFNIKTATGFGLDIWGEILNQGRLFYYKNPISGVTESVYLKGEQTVDGVYYSSEQIEELYRSVLFLKAMSNITNSTLASLNQMLQFYFADRGRVYVIEPDVMHIRYVFEFYVNKLEKAIFTSNIMPKPTGVKAYFDWIPQNEYFGFFVSNPNAGIVYKGTWDADNQSDFSSITLPVQRGDTYKVEGSTTIDGVVWNSNYNLVINKDISAGGSITSSDVDRDPVQPYAPIDQKPFYR